MVCKTQGSIPCTKGAELQWLRILVAQGEHMSSVPHPHMRLTTLCTSSYWGSDAIF